MKHRDRVRAALLLACITAGMVVGCSGAAGGGAGEERVSEEAVSTGDQFSCFSNSTVTSERGPSLACSGKSLASSAVCRPGTDYEISSGSGRETRIAILAPHGGAIDTHTDRIARDLVGILDAPYHIFDAHPTEACIGSSGSAFKALHVTSTGYNPRSSLDALGASSNTRGVAIHGHKNDGFICVGGGYAQARETFIDCWNGLSTGYVAKGPDFASCSGITGTQASNIVNRGNGGSGMQLEMPRDMRAALASGDAELLQSLAGAIRLAMGLSTTCKP